jgi:hypothetical protein
MFKRPDENTLELIRRTGSDDLRVATAAQQEFATALEMPLREGILVGDITGGIFERMVLESNSTPEFPLDLLSPGSEVDHVAFTNPGHGRIPERSVEGDYVMVPTYSVANSVDFLLRYARDARWDIVSRALNVMEAGVVKKINDDAFHTLLAAGVDRNILVYDADAAAGQFTKRLISLLKVIMRRNAGGNSASVKRGRLTDVYMSPEGVEDVRNWGVDQLDEVTRREIYTSTEDGAPVSRIFGVNLHPIDELGEGQEYQNYFTSDLSGALGPSNDVELVIALDLVNRDSFIMPIREEFRVYPDPALHRQQRQGYYGWLEMGLAALDNRRCLLGSF